MSEAMLADSKVKAILLPRCCICEEVPSDGIKGGYLINKFFVCTSCERKILDAEVGSPAYLEILELIKRIIR